MSTTTKWILGLVVLVIVVWGLTAASSKEVTDDESIKIGAVLSLSGIASQDGESIRDGLELAKEDLLGEGINVDIIYQDDQTDAKDTLSAIHVLATKNVDAVIGPTWSYLAEAGVPVLDQLKLVAVMPANTSEYVKAKSQYAFFTTIKVAKIEPVLAQWLREHNKKKVALIYNTGGAWYEVVAETVKRAVESAGGEIVFEEGVQFGSEAEVLPTTIAKLKNANADIIFSEIDDDQGIFVMLKKMKELGNTADIMSVTTSVGRVLNENSTSLGLENNFYALAPKTSTAFQEHYMERYGTLPGAYADSAYDSLMLLVDAMKSRGNVPLEVYLKEETDYQGYANSYDFDENGDILDGEWVVRTVGI